MNLSSNWFKLNQDGSSWGNPSLAGGGGLIQNEKGEWVKRYARAIGITTSVAVELWTSRDGIRLCIALKLPAVEIELDAKVVIDLVRNESSYFNSLNVLVDDCKEGLKQIPNVKIMHCNREGDKCADNLARHGALLDQDFVVFIHPLLRWSCLLDQIQWALCMTGLYPLTYRLFILLMEVPFYQYIYIYNLNTSLLSLPNSIFH